MKLYKYYNSLRLRMSFWLWWVPLRLSQGWRFHDEEDGTKVLLPPLASPLCGIWYKPIHLGGVFHAPSYIARGGFKGV